MLSYQQNFFSATEELTAEGFARLVVSDMVVKTIGEVRRLLAEAEAAATRGEDPRPLRDEAQKAKRRLPAIVWQATFATTLSRKGYEGRWRKQSAARLNGLFMLDVDHVENTRTAIADMLCRRNQPDLATMCREMGIVLVHVTPSGHGLRFVAIANEAIGNLADNQQHLASLLGTQCDEACKDASRLSFCPAFEDILFINKETLFNYDNPDYDEKFGPLYRGGNSQPRVLPAGNGSNGGNLPASTPAAEAPAMAGQKASGGRAADHGLGNGPGENEYRGVTYEKIISEWFRQNGGEPVVGERHQKLLRLAGDIRYIADNQPDVVVGIIRKHHVGSSYYAEDPADLAALADSACKKQMWGVIPRRFRSVLEAAGVQLPDAAGDADAAQAPATDYDAYAQRLLPLLSESPGLREAVADVPDRLKLGAVLAATAMLGTYLTRTWWEHFDGRLYRLSFLTYIVGSAASGKSFLTQLDRLLMAPLQAADRVGRAAEQHYKEEQRRRKASEKLPEMPHPVIRYCPSSTSNAILYRRLQDAIDSNINDPATGEPLHMHLITVESELATALRAQVGNWAGKNDLELKSFHNEMAGVDYANADSSNGIMQVNWNQVVSGTQESMSRKITQKNVLDGLVTRLSLFLMPQNDYQMLERRTYLRDHDRECYLRSLGYRLEEISGELRCPRLVDFCYKYEEQLTRQAAVEQDRCLDYFRKRIPVIMVRHTLVRMVLRQYEQLAKGADLVERDDDMEYARLIGDWCLEMQMTMFGQMVLDALELEAKTFAPVKMHKKTSAIFNALPKTFSLKELSESGNFTKENTKVTIHRWLKANLIVQNKDKNYTKIIENL